MLFQDSEGIPHGNDWAHGFMRGAIFHHESWKDLISDEDQGGLLIPIMILAHEHDPDPEMRPYKKKIDVELREKLIFGVSGAVTAIYRYFAPQRRRIAAAGLDAEVTANRPAREKSDATILAAAVRARNINTAAAKRTCSRTGDEAGPGRAQQGR